MGVASGERRGLRARRQGDRAEQLIGQIADDVVVGVVLEDQGDLGQAEQRNGAHGDALGDAVHHALNRDGDHALHFFRRVARKEGDDLHGDIGDIRIGLHRQFVEGVGAGEEKNAPSTRSQRRDGAGRW